MSHTTARRADGQRARRRARSRRGRRRHRDRAGVVCRRRKPARSRSSPTGSGSCGEPPCAAASAASAYRSSSGGGATPSNPCWRRCRHSGVSPGRCAHSGGHRVAGLRGAVRSRRMGLGRRLRGPCRCGRPGGHRVARRWPCHPARPGRDAWPGRARRRLRRCSRGEGPRSGRRSLRRRAGGERRARLLGARAGRRSPYRQGGNGPPRARRVDGRARRSALWIPVAGARVRPGFRRSVARNRRRSRGGGDLRRGGRSRCALCAATSARVAGRWRRCYRPRRASGA